MSTEFGKLAFSTSFNPTSAFPLDARSYFESYDKAEAAAKSAAVAGSDESIYYYGQTLVVFENNLATFYIIQPNEINPLTPLGTYFTINETQFEVDSNSGKLSLKGFDGAGSGQILSVGENGVEWIDASYTKSEIDNLLGGRNHLQRKIVDGISDIYQDIQEDFVKSQSYIYMIQIEGADGTNIYEEYLVLMVNDEPKVELVGSWNVDLSQYPTVEEIAKDYLKISDVYISDVIDTYFTVDKGTLSLSTELIKRLSDIENSLNSKYSKSEGELVQKTDLEKIEALEYDSENKVIVIQAENVQSLDKWIKDHASNTEGLSERNFSQNLEDILLDLGSYKHIKNVDQNEFNLSEQQTLSIKTISVDKISGIDNKISTALTPIEESLREINLTCSGLGNRIALAEQDIDVLNQRLTWQKLLDTTEGEG